MDIYNLLPQFIGDKILNVALRLNYSEPNILILKGDESSLRERYPDVYKNLLSCNHHKDSRTFLEYGQNLVASWIFEDYLIETLSNNGINVIHAGADKKREILPGIKVSSSSDSSVTYGGKTRLLEIMTDYTGYWNRTLKIDLRDCKYEKMRDSESLFLGISIKDRKYVLIDFKEKIEATYISCHYAYKKPAYQISISPQMLKPYDPGAVAGEIQGLLNK